MKKSTTRRALLMSVMSLFLCFTMLVGTTFAWFTDEVKSGTNQIVAGNLDVELEYWNGTAYTTVEGATELFDPDALWEPGHAEVVYLKISNKGTLALKYLFAINLLGETIGKTKDNADIKLSEHLQFGIVADVAGGAYGTDRAAAIAAVTNPQPLTQALSNQHGYASMKNATPMLPNDEKTLAVVVWMPTSVGNEANHDGENVPSIFLGLNLLATQVENEQDSFGTDYDSVATLPVYGVGVAAVNAVGDTEVQIRDLFGSKLGSVSVPSAAIDSGESTINVKIEKTALDSTVTVTDSQNAQSYDITVDGIVDGNTKDIKVQLRVGTGLTGVEVYHKNVKMDNVTYDPNDGYVTFFTKSFSPYTVVFDKIAADPEEPNPDHSDAPVAQVVVRNDLIGREDIDWVAGGPVSLTPGCETILDTAYSFSITGTAEEAQNSPYANWYCDFYVKLDRKLEANQIFLGGAYDSYNDGLFVGFHNGDLELEANTEVPLLGSVAAPWTYAEIATTVGSFACGVGDVNGSLSGATFTVMLRLTNPADETDFVNVSVVEYTFPTVVNNAQELQDAINNGDSEIVLGGDIDLSQGIVIPGN